MPAHITAVVHHAGGVGKTTTTLNLGYGLAAMGRRVLLVDLDPQADLSTRLGLTPGTPSLGTALLNPSARPGPVPVVWDAVTLDVLPGSLDLAGVELQLSAVPSRELRLRNALGEANGAALPATAAYDYILLDCPPSLSTMTQNALYAAHTVLVPVQAQDKAYMALGLLLDTLRDTNRFRTPALRVLGLLLTMYDPRGVIDRQIADALRTGYGPLVFESAIPTRRAAQTEHRRQAPVCATAPTSQSALAYHALAQEVLTRAEQ